MELILQQGLPHQQKAIDAICAVFDGVSFTSPVQFYENPHIPLDDPKIVSNIRTIQSDIPAQHKRNYPIDDCLNLDIKMETGTGKTYVYTKTMYELHKKYGFNKFIIAVPSLAIKAGTAQFLQDGYARRHFSDGCGYDVDMEVGVLDAPKAKKKGRLYFPSVVSEFIKGSCQNKKKIYVLLVNMQLLAVRANGMLSRDDYGYGAEGFYRPFDALRATKPVVLIDEPHRFSREQKSYKVITDEIKPQCVIRFGATFPETTTGRGSNKVTVKDYQNLLYDLNACASFNQGLIKGLAKEHFKSPSAKAEKVKILRVTSKTSVTMQYKKHNEEAKTFTLYPNDSLSIITDAFEGITIKEIDTTSVTFSNGVKKTTGEELDVDIYMTSYQEGMIKLALQRHFETERENFNRTFKIKTLALFFIDDITSYRASDEGKPPYVLEAFERLLKETIEKTITVLDEHESIYREYLEASLADISACHAGYFAQDNNDSDEEIAQQVDTILHGKKELLSFKKLDGSYNTLRFLFSKWTLKEGWDNPNVFTIAKLRSSGSEISKLQEVGRGLRLPVDENGNRISTEDFTLNYIVDFTEADFATQLVNQINGEIPQVSVLSEDKIKQVAEKLGKDPGVLFGELLSKQYIDWQRNILSDNRSAFFEEYPMFASGLSAGKVKDRNKAESKPIKIRKGVFNEIKELWEKINQRYLLYYDEDLNNTLDTAILGILEKPSIFNDVVLSSERDVVRSDGSQMSTEVGVGVQYTISRPIAYNMFLKRIMHTTNIPLAVMHKAMCEYVKKHGNIDSNYINESTVAIFCKEFYDWKISHLQGHFHYKKSSTTTKESSLTYDDGTPKDEIAQGRIGTKIVAGTPSEKYLYDTYAYDSPLEKQNITSDIESVTVYGKIPRSSIAIPTITGGTYSPDFMYVVTRTSGEKELNIIVETKDVENKTELRGTEEAKIKCAELFFNMLEQDGYKVYFKTQINNKQMKQIIDEVLR